MMDREIGQTNVKSQIWKKKCLIRNKHYSKSGFILLSFYKLIIFPVQFWYHQTSMWQIYWRTIQPLYDTRFVKRLSDKEQNSEIFFPRFENPSHIRATTLKLCSIYLMQFRKIGPEAWRRTLWWMRVQKGPIENWMTANHRNLSQNKSWSFEQDLLTYP